MDFLKSPFRLLLSVIVLLVLSACGYDGGDGVSNSMESVTELPSAVLTLPAGGTLRAYISIDGGARTELTISGNVATGSFPLLRAVYTILIEFEYTDSFGSTVTVATASQAVDLSSGDASISFADSDYDVDSYDDDGDGISNAAELAQGTNPKGDPIGDISGGWSIFETFTSPNTDCAGTDGYDMTITQNVNSITVTGAAGGVLTGTLIGSDLSLTGSRQITGEIGTVTYSSVTATIPSDCSSFTAQTNWSYTEPGFSCTGTGEISANRTSGGTTCGTTTTGSPTGIWEGNLTEIGGSLPVVVIVQGDQIRLISEQDGTASVGTILVSGADFTATTTLYALFGGPTGVTSSITGTFTAGSAMSGTYNYSDGNFGSFSLTYSPDTDKGSSLGTVAGTWGGGAVLVDMTIDNVGVVTGTSPCNYQGTVNIIDPAVNIYGISITTEPVCFGLEGVYNGYTYVSDRSSSNDTLNVVLDKNDRMVVDHVLRF